MQRLEKFKVNISYSLFVKDVSHIKTKTADI